MHFRTLGFKIRNNTMLPPGLDNENHSPWGSFMHHTSSPGAESKRLCVEPVAMLACKVYCEPY